MRLTRRMLRVLLLLSLAPTAWAQTAYVTDNLRLGLHHASDTSDRPFRMLESGQELEILSQERYYARVRLPDGTVGHVKSAYLVEEKPAVLIVAETRAQVERLEQELARVRGQFAGPAETISALEQQVVEQKRAIEQGLARIAELVDQNQDFAERQGSYKYSLPMTWVGGALAVCLFAGFIGGMWWIDYRSRKRHGGLRIY